MKKNAGHRYSLEEHEEDTTRTRCHVMVLHHPGKDESRGARGSSALHAASDTVLELKKSKDVVCVRAVKQRYGRR